jgi:hypothetical protein
MQIGFAGYLWRYAFYFVVVAAAIYGVLTLLERFWPTGAMWLYGSGASTGLNIAALMLPGMYLGQKWHRTEARPMPRGFGWVLSLACAGVALLLSGGLAAWRVRSEPSLQAAWADIQTEMGLFWTVLAVSAVFVVLVTRLAMWSAVRGEIRRAAK